MTRLAGPPSRSPARRRDLVAALGALLLPFEAWAEAHRLAPGDVVEVAAFRVPDLDRRATVDLDGAIAVPPLGRLAVAGMTLDELAAEIEAGLARDETLRGASVTVALAAVRPVLVSGDVAEPGAVEHRAGLTVRGAVALAGGTGRLREVDPAELARLEAEAEEVAAELSRIRLRLASIAAELDGADALPEGASGPTAQVERARLRVRAEEARREREHLEATVRALDVQIGALEESLALGEAQVERQRAEVDRLRESQRRGITPMTTVNEGDRVLAELSWQSSSTRADVLAAQERRRALAHERDRYDDRRRADLVAERAETLAEAEALRVRLDGLARRIAQFGRGAGLAPGVTIYRTVDGAETAIEAGEATPLRPGDPVEIELPPPGRGAGGDRLAAGDPLR